MTDILDALTTLRAWRDDDAELRIPSDEWGEKFTEALDIVMAAAEPDMGDGSAPPEENFWDDRTTPLAYGKSDADREVAAREAAYDKMRGDSAFIDATPDTWFVAGWNARNAAHSQGTVRL